MISKSMLDISPNAPFEELPFADKLPRGQPFVYLRLSNALAREFSVAMWWRTPDGHTARFLYSTGPLPPPSIAHAEIEALQQASQLTWRAAMEQYLQMHADELSQRQEEALRNAEPAVCEQLQVPAKELDSLLALVNERTVVSQHGLMVEQVVRIVARRIDGVLYDVIDTGADGSDQIDALYQHVRKYAGRIW